MPLVVNIPDKPPYADALHDDPVAEQDVRSEKPWHRLAILLAGQGFTVTEIAEKLDRTIAWVSLLLRQPWARERLMTEINAAGRSEIEVLLKSAGTGAIQRIITLSETAKNEAVKLAANRELIDRLLGKALERVEVTKKPALDLEQVNRELAVLEEQEKVLLGARRGSVGDAGAVRDREAEVPEKQGQDDPAPKSFGA
jgi:DNA-binding MarR family transcriptional regulator